MNMQRLQELVRSALPHRRDITSGLLVFAITAPLSGVVGWHKGFRSGSIQAGIEVSEEITAQRELREKAFKDKLAKERTAFDEQLGKDRVAFEQELDQRGKIHAANLEQIVTERYNNRLIAEKDAGHTLGYDEGKKEGITIGESSCKSECERSLEELKMYGRLWRAFTHSVYTFTESNPKKETDMRSLANAIVTIAHDGRQAAAGMASQLDGEIDAIKAALKDNDLERVKELIRTLQETLGTKAEIWNSNYRMTTVYK